MFYIYFYNTTKKIFLIFFSFHNNFRYKRNLIEFYFSNLRIQFIKAYSDILFFYSLSFEFFKINQGYIFGCYFICLLFDFL